MGGMIMSFGEKLLNLRTKYNLSQEALAYKLGVSRQAVSKWELGPSLPETESIISISDLFHVSLDYLLKDDPKDDDISRLVIRFVNSANSMSDAATDLIRIANDGIIDDSEKPRLSEIIKMLENVELLLNEMKTKLEL